MAHGRPPTVFCSAASSSTASQYAKLTVSSRICGLQYRHPGRQQPCRWIIRSEPGLAEKAVEIAKEVLDTDLTEVLETVQTTTSEAVITTQGAIQVGYWRKELFCPAYLVCSYLARCHSAKTGVQKALKLFLRRCSIPNIWREAHAYLIALYLALHYQLTILKAELNSESIWYTRAS